MPNGRKSVDFCQGGMRREDMTCARDGVRLWSGPADGRFEWVLQEETQCGAKGAPAAGNSENRRRPAVFEAEKPEKAPIDEKTLPKLLTSPLSSVIIEGFALQKA